MEPPGVGDNAGIQANGLVLGDVDAHVIEKPVDNLRCGRSGGFHDINIPVKLRGAVVIHIYHGNAALERPADIAAALRA